MTNKTMYIIQFHHVNITQKESIYFTIHPIEIYIEKSNPPYDYVDTIGNYYAAANLRNTPQSALAYAKEEYLQITNNLKHEYEKKIKNLNKNIKICKEITIHNVTSMHSKVSRHNCCIYLNDSIPEIHFHNDDTIKE